MIHYIYNKTSIFYLMTFCLIFLFFLCSINSCPNNCSGHGKCTTSSSVPGRVYCECDKYWKGEACDIPYCKNNCGSPDHGYCDLTGEKLCVCNDSWQGMFSLMLCRGGSSLVYAEQTPVLLYMYYNSGPLSEAEILCCQRKQEVMSSLDFWKIK